MKYNSIVLAMLHLTLKRGGGVRAFSVASPWQNSCLVRPLISSCLAATHTAPNTDLDNNSSSPKILNLSTATKQELQTIITSWGHPKYRADQVYNWIRVQGVTDIADMTNLPKKLRQQLQDFSKPAALELAFEMISKDGTIKRAYRCFDGQIIESVLMPYQDGRYTACISSQAGCAQGCVFCATGQMGFSRQLTVDEIFEQVSRFSAELNHQSKDSLDDDNEQQQQQQQDGTAEATKAHGRNKRLSNVVFMGMGEPLANYRNVVGAVNRITNDLGIGARKITVSTVGIVPNIRKIVEDPNVPQVRLAVSLHCATDEERSALLPANKRYGGLRELMTALYDYIETTGRRVTLEWALIEGQNDTPETARTLGRLIAKYKLRRDMVHVNVIPLNPTGGFGGSPSSRGRVNNFCNTLEKDFGIACTPRVRRGIDIDAGCGQLKSKVLEKEQRSKSAGEAKSEFANVPLNPPSMMNPTIGVYDDLDTEEDDGESEALIGDVAMDNFSFEGAIDFESGDYDDPEYDNDVDKAEAARLISLVQGTTIRLGDIQESSDTSGGEDEPIKKQKKRRRGRREANSSLSR